MFRKFTLIGDQNLHLADYVAGGNELCFTLQIRALSVILNFCPQNAHD